MTACNGSRVCVLLVAMSTFCAPTMRAWEDTRPRLAAVPGRVAAGEGHTVVVASDGTVWAWGSNAYGQLGDGSTTNRNTPVQVIGLTGVVGVACGSGHSLAVRSDGSVWAWGRNDRNQVAGGLTGNQRTPMQVGGLSAVVAVAGADNHSVALKSDGTVWAWGLYDSLLLGGLLQAPGTPTQVGGLSSIVAVAAGGSHGLAVRSDGTVWAWGSNSSGELGDGSTANRNPAVQVSGLSGAVAVAAGGSHSLALKSDGSVWAWGNNAFGQVGDGSLSHRSTPVIVTGGTGVAAVAAGTSFSLALKLDGSGWLWGDNRAGQLGDGTTVSQYVPAPSNGLSGLVALDGGFHHGVAMRTDGSVVGWGENSEGQLGNGTAVSELKPVAVVPFGSPDLALEKTHGGDFTAGLPATYTLTVKNVGRSASSGLITVTDTVPAGLNNPIGSGDGWTCYTSGPIVTCTSSLAMQPGAASTISLRVDVTASAAPRVTNTATVSNNSEQNVSNNSAADAANVIASGCAYGVTPASAALPVGGGSAPFTIQTGANCPWSVTGLPAWITASATAGIGPGSVTLTAAANSGTGRSASVMIAGVAVTVTQAGGACTYSLSSTVLAVPWSGGSGSVDLTTGPACQWSAVSAAAWLTFSSAAAGAGNARVTFVTGANAGSAARSTTLTIAGLVVTVQQSGAPSTTLDFAGSLPHVASGGGWKTTFTITNTGSNVVNIRLDFWGNDGKPLSLPMSFPQSAATGSVQGATLARSIEAGATLLVESEASATAAVQSGWGELLSSGPVTGVAVFRQRSEGGTEQEAAVPLETQTGKRYLLPFDNSAGYLTGLAVANHTTDYLILGVFQRDEAGRQIGFEALTVRPKGHEAFDLKSRWPALANRRGSLEIDSPRVDGISVLGLRFHPQGPFTTLPVTVK